jgi:hypothetical protein
MKPFYPLVVLLFAGAVLAGSASAQQAVTPARPAAAAPDNPANDPLFDVPPLPQGKVSLVGGTVAKIDRVRNRLWVRPFGGGDMQMSFDERSHIYRDGIETTQLGIRKGDRVYVDTMLDGSRVFARNIRVETTVTPAGARGQLLAFDPATGNMTIRDDLSSQPVTFQVTSNTAIRQDDQPASRAELRPGTLVAVRFSPNQANRGIAQDVSILAVPGNTFVFSGTVTYLDLRLGVFALENRTDNRNYELHFHPGIGAADKLSVGSDVTVSAVFNGSGYNVTNLTVNQARNEGPEK